ncbi:MAG: hypothetical protein ACLR8Y_03715 [Alistipes indistinctus]
MLTLVAAAGPVVRIIGYFPARTRSRVDMPVFQSDISPGPAEAPTSVSRSDPSAVFLHLGHVGGIF